MPDVLDRVATGCGMKLSVKRARHSTGSRSYYIAEITFVRRLPELMDDYLIYSNAKGEKVSLADWHAEHAALDEQQMVEAEAVDWWEECGDEEGECVVEEEDGGVVDPSAADTREQRTEKLDGRALAAKLCELRDKELTDQETRWLAWLEMADATAMPRAASPEADAAPSQPVLFM
eukprot:4948175-Prymnesium_polylepis.1